MTYFVCVALWLLSGFLAAWLMQRYIDGRQFDYALGPTLVITVCGPIVLFIVVSILTGRGLANGSEYLNKAFKKPVFKAKEPK